MCQQCVDVWQDVADQIEDVGYAVVATDQNGWLTRTHTIGLIESFGHPELIITDAKPLGAARTIAAWASGVRLGLLDEGFLVSPAFADDDEEACGFVVVDGGHLTDGTFSMWWDYYESMGRCPPDLRAYQVVLPDSGFCPAHKGSATLLDGRGSVRAPRTGPNRAQRRDAQRRRRRRGR